MDNIKKTICNKLWPFRKLDQKGQAVVELALLLPFLAIILLATVIIYEYSSKKVISSIKLRHEMRKSMYSGASRNFNLVTKTERIRVELPGRMKQVFQMPFISDELEIKFYQGSHKGYRQNKFWMRKSLRNIYVENSLNF